MKDIKSDPLLLEIQEEINRENMDRFFRKYGSYLMAAAVVAIIAAGGYKIYQTQRNTQSAKAGSAIYDIIKDDQPVDEFGMKKLDEAAKVSGYKEIALLNKAQAQIENDDISGALVNFDAIANDNNADKALKDLAALNAANLQLNMDPKNKQLEQRLSILTSADNTFKYSAMELLASYYLQNGQDKKAGEVLQKLTTDANVPVTISKRARQMMPAEDNKALNAEEE